LRRERYAHSSVLVRPPDPAFVFSLFVTCRRQGQGLLRDRDSDTAEMKREGTAVSTFAAVRLEHVDWHLFPQRQMTSPFYSSSPSPSRHHRLLARPAVQTKGGGISTGRGVDACAASTQPLFLCVTCFPILISHAFSRHDGLYTVREEVVQNCLDPQAPQVPQGFSTFS
jgi:hypothetical protein